MKIKFTTLIMDDLETGDCFAHKDAFYMKVAGAGSRKAVNLETGELCDVYGYITPVKAELMIKPGKEKEHEETE